MAFAAKYFSKQYVSKQIATLTKALESVSTNLSIVALLGLALIPMLPDRAASTLTRPSPPPAVASLKSASAPVEVVRAKPVLVPQLPLSSEAALRPPVPPPDPAATGPVPSVDGSLRILARVSRERRRRVQRQASHPESGDLGKAGAKTASAQTPVPPSGPKSETTKSDTSKAEPPVPEEWSDAEIIAALKDCLKRLAPLGAEIEIAPAVRHDQCGAPAPVMLKRIGSGSNRVEFQPPPMLNCAMVAGLSTWVEKTLQPMAQEVLGTSIVRLRGASGYACRNRNGTRLHADRLSEHALANAVDIMGFVTADGRTIDVLSKWGPTARDIREQKEKLAEAKATAKEQAKATAKENDKDALNAAVEAAVRARKEAADARKAAAKLPARKRKQAQADAQRKEEEADRKAEEAERLAEQVEKREAELRRGTLRTAQIQKLGRGVDAKTVPTTATSETNRPSAETTFLHRLHKGACGTFGTVLGPEANEAHRNHFHFDLAPRRRSAFCE